MLAEPSRQVAERLGAAESGLMTIGDTPVERLS
jgi:hypothetical protein